MTPEILAIINQLIASAIGCINLLVGAAIGFLTAYLADNRNRKWQLQDKQREIRRDIRRKRISEAEAMIESIYELAFKLVNAETKIIDKNEIGSSLHPNLMNEVQDIKKKIGIVMNVGDQELIDCINQLHDILIAKGNRILTLLRETK